MAFFVPMDVIQELPRGNLTLYINLLGEIDPDEFKVKGQDHSNPF